MLSPITEKPMTLQLTKQKMEFRKDEFEIVYHSFKCEDSGAEFVSPEQLKINTEQLHNAYRAKHNIPPHNEIRQIREQYDIAASKMSEIMEFGINTYKQYENGEIPSLPNARLIKKIAANPLEFRQQVLESQVLNDKEKDKILRKIQEIVVKNAQNSDNEIIEILNYKSADITTGNTLPNIKKILNMILFFSENMKPYKTKLNKLLFYADFLHFKHHAKSISGMKYRAIQYGPVPADFQILYGYANVKNYVEIEERPLDNCSHTGECFKKANKNIDFDAFEPEELESLKNVTEKFKNYTTNKIIEQSHQEKGWIENNELHNLIDYRYAFEI